MHHHCPTMTSDTPHQSRHRESKKIQENTPPAAAANNRPCFVDNNNESPQSETINIPMKHPNDATQDAETSKYVTTTMTEAAAEDTGRERLKRHRVEVAGRVWIPDIWGKEELLKDWIDCGVFDASLMNSNIMSAREALMEEGRRANSSRLRIENSC